MNPLGCGLLACGLAATLCAGCASRPDGPASAGSDSIAASASTVIPARVDLTVRVGLYGGPVKPDGTMGLVNAPAQGVKVTVTGATTISTTTGPAGLAVFPVAPGRWTVTSTCGNPQTVDVVGPVVAAIQCDVP